MTTLMQTALKAIQEIQQADGIGAAMWELSEETKICSSILRGVVAQLIACELVYSDQWETPTGQSEVLFYAYSAE